MQPSLIKKSPKRAENIQSNTKPPALQENSVDDVEEDPSTWYNFCEEYHEIIEQLPLELKRGFQLVQDLEQHMQTSQNDMAAAIMRYTRRRTISVATPSRRNVKVVNSARGSPTSLAEELFPALDRHKTVQPRSLASALGALATELAKDTRSTICAGEDKVEQANAMSDTVDRHIRRLDADLAKYEDSLVIGLRNGTLPSSEAPSLFALAAAAAADAAKQSAVISVGTRGGTDRFMSSVSAVAHDERYGNRLDENDGAESAGSKLLRARGTEPKNIGGAAGRGRLPAISDESLSEAEEDTDEPTYCYCNQFSFGEMIACDNDDCAIEWFHLSCTGLSEVPKGKFFCRYCVKALGVQPRGLRK